MSGQIGTFKREQLEPSVESGQWRVLSLTQPWASALFIPGLKRVETRGWSTNYRGRLYIHASKGYPKWAQEFFDREMRAENFAPLPIYRGFILGHVELVDIRRTEDLREQLSETEERWGDYGDRRYGWITENPVLLPDPIPAKGQLGLWTCDHTDLKSCE